MSFFGLSTGSAVRQGLTSRDTQKKGANPNVTPVKTQETFHTEAYTPAPIIQPANITQADFYRYGKPSDENSQELEYHPRRFDRFFVGENEQEEASIRIFISLLNLPTKSIQVDCTFFELTDLTPKAVMMISARGRICWYGGLKEGWVSCSKEASSAILSFTPFFICPLQ